MNDRRDNQKKSALNVRAGVTGGHNGLLDLFNRPTPAGV